MNTTPRTALILGATGGVGGEITRALLASGWQVRALTRGRTGGDPAIRWIRGDALHHDDVVTAAAGAQVIVHAVNPPGYRNWENLVIPMIDNSIAAARSSGARIVLPGTIYNYGHDAFPLLREDSQQHAVTRKGEIRVMLERHMEDAASHGVRSLILRCGDFFGPRAGNNWFAQGIVKPGKPLRAMHYPGPPTLGHAWAYLPDVGDTVAALLEREADLDRFARFHFAGHFVSGDTLHASIRRAARKPDLPMRRFPWPLVTLAAPFNETLRELRKMRYLWQTPIELDGTRLRTFLGEVPHTSLDEAVGATLRTLEVLP